MDLGAFLEKVEQMADSDGVPDEQLVANIPKFLVGNVLEDYNSWGKGIRTWQEFKVRICEVMGYRVNRKAIMEKIENLKQGRDETFTNYKSKMESLFQKVRPMLLVEDEIGFLLGGMRREIFNLIANRNYESIPDLTYAAQCAERNLIYAPKRAPFNYNQNQQQFQRRKPEGQVHAVEQDAEDFDYPDCENGEFEVEYFDDENVYEMRTENKPKPGFVRNNPQGNNGNGQPFRKFVPKGNGQNRPPRQEYSSGPYCGICRKPGHYTKACELYGQNFMKKLMEEMLKNMTEAKSREIPKGAEKNAGKPEKDKQQDSGDENSKH
jgi:hypothetical protein